MKKFGKFEKRLASEGAAVKEKQEKQPEAQSVLLRTYFTSLLSLVLCVTMFLGTSYAWFSSEVTNQNNEIYVGTLKVGLYKGETNLVGSDEKLFDSNIRWEPGYTALETVQVINQGDLAFKYDLTFTDGTLAEGSTSNLEDVAANFEVWVFDHAKNTYEKPESFQMINDENGWKSAGTLAEVLEGGIVLSGSMDQVRKADQEPDAVNEGTTDGLKIVHTYTIALHMKESAGSNPEDSKKLMGQKITLNVKLVAYQMAKEEDGLGSSQYDKMVDTAEDLQAALAEGGTVALVRDIDLKGTKLTIPADVTAILDLNGHKITDKGVAGDSMIVNNGTLTIRGEGEIAITFEGTVDDSKAFNTISNRGVLIVDGGRISNTSSENQIGYAIDNYNGASLTVNGGEIVASGSSYYDGIRLFCGDKETVVTVNGGKISTIWAQNPSAGKATEVKGTVIVNGLSDASDDAVTTIYYENFTIVKVKVTEGHKVDVKPYGNDGKEVTTTKVVDDYTVYSFVQNTNP